MVGFGFLFFLGDLDFFFISIGWNDVYEEFWIFFIILRFYWDIWLRYLNGKKLFLFWEIGELLVI